jgi:Ca-activated chloride channel family protein
VRSNRLGWISFAWLVVACGGAQAPTEGRDPELVLFEGELGNDFVVSDARSTIVSRLRIHTQAMANAPRPPINLALVVDTSGSMQGDPIVDARNASLALLDVLRPGDRLAVVAFHSRTDVLLPSTQLSGNMTELRERIAQMEARGTTDLAGGLRAGLEELVRHFEPQGVNRLVLVSDGVPNDASPILPLAQVAGERGIRITAIGLGLDYDETLLGHIAQRSGGHFHYVEDSAEVATVFRDELLRFERVLARNLVLELRPGPGVRIDGVLGQNVTTDGTAVRVSLGDLSEGDRRDVIVRLEAEPRRVGATVELMDAVLTFQDAVQNAGSLERRVFLGARSTDRDADLDAGRHRDVELAAAQVMAAVTTVQAIERARGGDVEEARRLLDRATAAAEVQFDDDVVRGQVAEMRALREALPAVSSEPAPSTAPAAPSDEASASEATATPPAAIVRRAHDQAMRIMQTTPGE